MLKTALIAVEYGGGLVQFETSVGSERCETFAMRRHLAIGHRLEIAGNTQVLPQDAE